MNFGKGIMKEGGTKSSFSDSVSDSDNELTFSTPAQEQRKKRERNTKFGDISGISGLKAQHDISSEGETSGGTDKEVKKPRLSGSMESETIPMEVIEGKGEVSETNENQRVLLEDSCPISDKGGGGSPEGGGGSPEGGGGSPEGGGGSPEGGGRSPKGGGGSPESGGGSPERDH